MLLNINATRAFILFFYDIKSKRISHRHSCNVYMRSLCGSCPADVATAARPRTATLGQYNGRFYSYNMTQRRVVDFVRVGYFVPLNGQLNGHPSSVGLLLLSHQHYNNYVNNMYNIVCLNYWCRFGIGYTY